MPSMTSQEFTEFLRRPLVASLTTLRADGTPQVTPVWYESDGEAFFCIFDRDSVKARNLRRDTRVSLCIATHDDPYQYVIVDGTGEISAKGVAERCHSISTRYWGEERGGRFARELVTKGDTVVLSVRPNRVLTESTA